MSDIRLWPAHLPSWFDGLDRHLSEVVGEVAGFDLRNELDDKATVLLAMVGDANEVTAGLRWMNGLDPALSLNLIVVTIDSYLGSDSSQVRAQEAGAAISAVRSLAVHQGTSVRANAICLPESTVGEGRTEIRGPLPLQPELEDLVYAVQFLAGPDSVYLSGQVLFVNGGRQLFSNHTS